MAMGASLALYADRQRLRPPLADPDSSLASCSLASNTSTAASSSVANSAPSSPGGSQQSDDEEQARVSRDNKLHLGNQVRERASQNEKVSSFPRAQIRSFPFIAPKLIYEPPSPKKTWKCIMGLFL